MFTRANRHRGTGDVIGGMSIGPEAAGSGQISDKYQYYGHADFSDDAAPGASMAGSNSRKPVVGMKIRVALVSALLAVSGCTTLSGKAPTVTPTPASTPPSSGKVTTTIISAMGGGLVSGSIGAGLSEAEKRSALEAEYKALEYTTSGQKVTWKGAQASRYGEVVPAQPYRVGSQDCRQYTQTVFTGGAGVTARGTACRNADGSWTPLT
ncbi:surface antigen [Mesorhizobium loti]|jgi:surface antigen|uniref:Surface antigen n=2 Tax=Phyllobacteriaceae TaxID=69277 RepID=A0A8E3B5L8_RHILI|nr:surface antigen [Mesorhizobium loti]